MLSLRSCSVFALPITWLGVISLGGLLLTTKAYCPDVDVERDFVRDVDRITGRGGGVPGFKF